MLKILNLIDKERERAASRAEHLRRSAKTLDDMRRFITDPPKGHTLPRLLVITNHFQVPHAWKDDTNIEQAVYEVLDTLAPEILHAAKLRLEGKAQAEQTRAAALEAQIRASLATPNEAEAPLAAKDSHD